MSQPRGGPMLTGHASHQSGLDIDIWMLPPDRLNLTVQEREDLSSISMRRSAGAYTNDSWSPQHEALMKAAASDPRVARIFVFPGAKVAMCKNATGDRSWLNKIRPWWGHHYHFHVRLKCPAGDNNCTNQAPPPAGDGCADADRWVRDILNPPPPNPNPSPPRGPVTMAQLPGQCSTVLTSD
jgi:penicillin-insensitive murein endopeptidase